MKWMVKEFFGGLFGSVQSEEVTEFLNTLPEDRALEAKVIIFNTFAWVYYREEL